MSCFLDILRCILRIDGDDDREEDTRRRNSNRNYSPYYDTSYRSYVPTTSTATTPLISTHLTRKPSDACTASPIRTPNYSNSWNSTPTKLPDKSRAATQKPTNPLLPPSPSTTKISLNKAVNSATTKTSTPKFPQGLSSFPSQPSAPLTKLLASSSKIQQPSDAFTSTQVPTSISWNSTPTKLPETLNVSFVKPKATIDSSVVIKSEASIRTTNKSCEATQKLKDSTLPPSLFSTEISWKKAVDSGTNKSSAQILSHRLSSFSPQPSPSLTKLVASSSKPLPSVSTPPPSSPKTTRPSTKPILSLAPSNPTNQNSKTTYILVEKGTSPIYAIPEDFKDLIKNDVVPGILKRPLSPSTYKDYFEALLYAEDFYIEKWDGFEMKNVTLELHEAAIYKRKGKYNKKKMNDEKDDKVFVAFEIDSIPEKRPFLLSRDFVSVRPSGTKTEPFQGLIYRVVKSNHVLVEFGKDFHDQHYSACKYDVKFSFNRVCLKRAHQAVEAASDPLFRKFLFPDSISRSSLLTAESQPINSTLHWNQVSAIHHILSHQNAIPYLVEGPISVYKSEDFWFLSRTGFVVCEAVLQVCQTSPSCRILICAPTNNACDVITRKLKEKIQDSDIFRANAAFREFDGVPKDILPSCLYKEEKECFSCPSLQELRKFKVILSTFMSSFRLHNVGIMAGHFNHIFLVDASSVTEPEAMVALANLANESTAVTITGAPGNHSGWIRSDIARQNGLLMSYFERLRKSKMYESLDSKLITVL